MKKLVLFVPTVLVCLLRVSSCEDIFDSIMMTIADHTYGITIRDPYGLTFNAILDWYPIDGEITEDSCEFSFHQGGENKGIAFSNERKGYYSKNIKDSAHVYILDFEGTSSIFKNCIVSQENLSKLSSDMIKARLTIYHEQLDKKGNGEFTYPPEPGDDVRVQYYYH